MHHDTFKWLHSISACGAAFPLFFFPFLVFIAVGACILV